MKKILLHNYEVFIKTSYHSCHYSTELIIVLNEHKEQTLYNSFGA